MKLKVGVLVNPIAGMGGRVGLKGTDGRDRLRQAIALGAEPQAPARAQHFFRELLPLTDRIHWHSSWTLGGRWLHEAGFEWTDVRPGVSRRISLENTTERKDSLELLRALQVAEVDLLVFVGGDGTARDVLSVVGNNLPVLGVPAGVKMHSGVFAINPQGAARIVEDLVEGRIVTSATRTVRDFDDAAASTDAIKLKSFGELSVPESHVYLQQTKVGGRESEPLAIEEICAEILNLQLRSRPIVIGPGGTCLAIKTALGFEGTLRGVDILFPDGRTQLDVGEAALLALVDASEIFLIMSFTRRQGFLLGRGNQMLSAAVLNRIQWPADVLIVGTRTKLASLAGRPLLVDSADPEFDRKVSGLIEIVSGFEDRLIYRVATDAALNPAT